MAVECLAVSSAGYLLSYPCRGRNTAAAFHRPSCSSRMLMKTPTSHRLNVPRRRSPLVKKYRRLRPQCNIDYDSDNEWFFARLTTLYQLHCHAMLACKLAGRCIYCKVCRSQILTLAAGVRSQVCSCGMFHGESGTVPGFLPFPCQFSSHQMLCFSHLLSAPGTIVYLRREYQPALRIREQLSWNLTSMDGKPYADLYVTVPLAVETARWK